MKKFNRFLSAVCVAAMILSVTACSKEESDNTSVADETNSITIAVESSVVETETSASSEESTTSSENTELPMTNEKGEYTIEGATFETIYGSQLGSYLNHQYYYDGKAIPVAESNFYFIHEFTDLSEQAYRYGYYPLTSEGFVDLSYVFENGQLGEFTFEIFGDFYQEYAENQILSTYIVLELAEEQGLKLSDETQAEIDDYIEIIREAADSYGLDLNDYLKIFYGPSCDTAAFRGILERYYLSTLYSDTYIANYAFEDEQLYVPKVCHALFLAQDGLVTEEQDQEALDNAKAMLDVCQTPDDIITLGEALKADGTVMEVATYAVEKDLFVPEFEDWAYDESRKEGDMDIVKTYYGYHVMGYIGIDEISEESKTAIALQALNDEIGAIAFSNVHDFNTPDEIIRPKPVVAEDAEETEETIPTLNVDESGNIVVETTVSINAAVDADLNPAQDESPAKTRKTTGIIAITVGVIALVAAGCFGILSIGKNKKNEEDSDDAEDVDDASDDNNDEA